MSTTAPRFDLYATVHKGLRACLAQALVSVGRADWDDAAATAAVLGEVRGLIELCHVHLHSEDRFVHAVMEARLPGSSLATATDHRGHERELAGLAADLDSIALGAAADRAAAGAALYRRLAVFVAENFEHMHVEETRNNALLWAHFTDDEIRAIQRELVAALPPGVHLRFLGWMLLHANPDERLRVLRGVRAQAPAEVFNGARELLQAALGPREWASLEAVL